MSLISSINKISKPRKRELTKSSLIIASAKAFSLYGYHNTTIAQIAQLAGVTERTFYRYFSSKEATVLEEITRLNDLFLSLLNEQPESIEILDAVDRVLSEMNPRYGMAASTVLLVSRGSFDERLAKDLARISWFYEEQLQVELEKRITKSFPSVDSEDARVSSIAIARAVSGGIRFALLECAQSGIEEATKSPLFMQSYRRFIGVYERSCRIKPAPIDATISQVHH